MTSTDQNSSFQKCKLKRLGIIIHYRKDSDDREFNLKTLLRYLDYAFEVAQITVINDDENVDPVLNYVKTTYPDVKILYCKNPDHFKKAYCFNEAGYQSDGDVLCFWDVDVLIDYQSVKIAYDEILSGGSNHIYPFNGTFIDVQKEVFQHLDDEWAKLFTTYNQLLLYKSEHMHFASGESPGGCNLISREAFEKIKGYDERFIGWGFEDTDYFYRSRRVNKVKYLQGNENICWHLHHDQAIRTENPHYYNNMTIFNQNNSQ